jgi:hypothetical protein
MAVFTFYCHGTGSHRSRRDHEIITTFSEHTQRNFHILDGPGAPDAKDSQGRLSHTVPGRLSAQNHPIPGTYNPFRTDKTLKSDKDATMEDMLAEAKKLSTDLGRVDAIREAQGIDISTPRGQQKFAERAVDNLGFGLNNPVESTTLKRANRTDPGSKVVGVKTQYYREFTQNKAGIGVEKKGTMTGYGWDDNIAEAVALLFDKGVNEETQPDGDSSRPISTIHRVNMIGWSRGAVTCLRIANRLEEIGLPIEINIFAVDPVAGGDAGTRLEDTRIIPPNVRNYLATLAMDEQRKGFAPQDLSRIRVRDTAKSNVVFLPFPGKHNTQVRLDNRGLNEAARVVWSLAYRFLANFGTPLETGFAELLRPAKAVDEYSKMLLKRGRYHELRNQGMKQRVQGGLGGRQFTGMDQQAHKLSLPALSHYVTDYNYFVNVHHRALFQMLYPKTTEWFFEAGTEVGIKVDKAHPVGWELWKMRFDAPSALELLERVGLGRSAEGFQLPPRGAGKAAADLGLNEILARGRMDQMGILV